MSSLINKAKEVLSGDKKHSTEQPEGTHGTHSSRAANAADPRIDSDRDHRAAPHSTTTGFHDNTFSSSTAPHHTTTTHQSNVPEGTVGPHSSRVANAADPRVDSDMDSTRHTGGMTGATHGTTHGSTTHGSTTHGSTLSSGPGPVTQTAGPHSSNLMNKADPRVDSDMDSTRHAGGMTGANHGTTHSSTTHGSTLSSGPGSANQTAGPHSSNLMNKADPRVDSDMDSTRRTGGMTGATHGTTHSSTTHGSTLSSGPGPATQTAGPHSSNVANKADPRVDSDMDSSNRFGSNTTTTGSHTTGTHTTGTHTTGTHGTHTTGTHTTGPHSSNLMNKADPRVDSDPYNRTTTQGGAPEGTFGPHSSRAANAADPRVDSDRDNVRQTRSTTAGHGTTGTTTGMTSHTGPAPSTAGPHKSDMLNKVDPRVDSDLDGSKTMGDNKTFKSDNGLAHKDPTDAAQVPPSVLQKHIGAPVVEHGDHAHGREKRHSVSHQDEHRGL